MAGDGRGALSEELREGLVAYASEHTVMYINMRTMFERAWADIRTEVGTVLSRKSVLDEAGVL